MKSIISKLKALLAIISGIGLLIFFFKSKKDKAPDKFPLADEKKAAEKEVEDLKTDLQKLEQKEYNDKEIEERFNGK